MKTKSLIPALGTFALLLCLSSCQKNADKKEDTDHGTEAAMHADDQNRFSVELEAVANDANSLLETTAGFSARQQRVESLICDASVASDTSASIRTITITYNGTNCYGNRTRTGTVVISMPQGIRWKNAGAAVTISYQNLKLTRVSDNKSITINGSKTYTNTSGGLLINLATAGPIIHTITSNNLSVTFEDGTQRTWQVAHKRTFTYNNGVVIAITGLHTEGNLSNIAEWGVNRFNHAFTTSVTQPVIVRQSCDFRVTSGELTHTTALFKSSAIFGLDINGNAASCPGTGKYYMKLAWTANAGSTYSVILPY